MITESTSTSPRLRIVLELPALDSTSGGRFGPNFTDEVVPVELQSFSVE